MHSPHLRSGELYSTSLRAKCIHELFGIFLHGRALSFLSLPHEFVETIISVCQYGLMDVYFIFCVIIQYCFIFPLAHIFVALVPGSSKCHLAISPFLWRAFVFHFFVYFHIPGTTRCSRLIWHTSCPSPKIRCFSKDLWFLLLENSIRNQDLGSGVLLSPGISLFLSPLR